MGDINSIVGAIDESKATRVWFTTDWYSIKKVTRAKEARLGYNVIDAIKMRSNQVQHVVYNSGAYAGEVPTKIPEMHSKVCRNNDKARKMRYHGIHTKCFIFNIA